MGNSVNITTNISINGGKVTNLGGTNTFNTTGSFSLYNPQTVGTSGWTPLSSSISQYSIIHFETDTTASIITIATDATGSNKICSLVPAYGGVASFTPPAGSSVTYYAQATPSSALIEVRGTPL